jgi:Zn-dependent protease
LDPSAILRQLAISALPVLIAITFHELSHGLIAYKLGDPTAKMMGLCQLFSVKSHQGFILNGFHSFNYAAIL